MNTLEEAAKILENGWCIANLLVHNDGEDKYCSLGAIAAVEMGYTWDTIKDLSHNERQDLEDDLYSKLDESPAVKALADELREQGKTHVRRNVSAVVRFNDSQDSVEPVLEMFKYAAKRL